LPPETWQTAAAVPARDSIQPAVEQVRARAAFRVSIARLAVGFGLLLAAELSRLVPGSRWEQHVPTLLLYCLAAGGLLVAQRWAQLRAISAALFPFLDAITVFALQLRGVPLQGGAPAHLSLSVYVIIVMLSAFTMRPAIVWAAALLSFACEAALQGVPGAGASSAFASGAVLVASAAIASWVTLRTQEGLLRLLEEEAQGQQASELSEELVARLVHEEVQSKLANERSEELARANNHIAQVNAILKDQHRKLQLAQREAEKLTALLVHDMKGPLSSVLGFVELVAMQLGARTEAQGQVKHLRTALAQGGRLLDMIESLLAIARLERGAVTARREEAAVLPLLQAVVHAQSARAQQQGTLLGAQAEPDLTAAFDRDLMQRLLENLVSNALSHTKEGDRIELSAVVEEGELVLAVRNSGPPIPEELRNTLFERFVTSAKPGRGNVGLGLYLCRLVAEAHQGSIKVEDAEGWAVSFVARVPAGLAARGATPAANRPLPLPADGAPPLRVISGSGGS
jgi:signal transduction histidine kinase